MNKTLTIFIILSFVGLAVFGMVVYINGMTANESGYMAGCIFTGKTMLCRMSVIEHISLWQSMFTAIPQGGLMFMALLILLVAVVLTPPRFSGSGVLIKRLYLREHPDLLLFNPLKEAFSQGILNPKIY